MRKHGGMTWKRTWMWGTTPRLQELDLGPLTPAEREGCVSTTTIRVDRDGRKRWRGNDHLKGTQSCTYLFEFAF